jgi:hypothetical protein
VDLRGHFVRRYLKWEKELERRRYSSKPPKKKMILVWKLNVYLNFSSWNTLTSHAVQTGALVLPANW